MMGIIVWLLVGAIVGWLAGMIMGRTFGLLGDMAVGIVGAFIGGLIFSRGEINNAPLSAESFAVSLVGALILVGIIRLVRRSPLI